MIAKEISEFIKLLTDGANNFASLGQTAIWCLFTMVLGGVLIYDKREARRKDDLDREIREKKIIVESTQAAALLKLADAYERLADTHKAQVDIFLNLRRP